MSTIPSTPSPGGSAVPPPPVAYAPANTPSGTPSTPTHPASGRSVDSPAPPKRNHNAKSGSGNSPLGRSGGYAKSPSPTTPRDDNDSAPSVRNNDEADVVQRRAEEEAQQEHLKEAVGRMNDLAGALYRNINYRISNDSDKTMVEVVDADTDRVIRTLPPQSMLDRVNRLYDTLGLIFDELG